MIVVSGAIGCGKSSLTDLISKEFNLKAQYESVDDNEILPLYYSNMEKYALLLQIYFLNTRFKAIKESFKYNNTINDRSIYEDSLFFHKLADDGLVSKKEVEIYDNLVENILEELNESKKKSPDLLIHIEVSFDKMLERIERRGREYEQINNNPELFDYYKDLNNRYYSWFENYNHSPKMIIKGDNLDFVNNEEDKKIVVEDVRKELLKHNITF